MNTPSILRALDAQIAQLQQARLLLSDFAVTTAPSIKPAKHRERAPATAKSVDAKPVRKWIMSEEGKGRIAAAQKMRWAKRKKVAQSATPVVVAKEALAPAKNAPVRKQTLR